jgi:ABC-type Zn uptake system ZnuABC Zn-binding protein ZnuA
MVRIEFRDPHHFFIKLWTFKISNRQRKKEWLDCLKDSGYRIKNPRRAVVEALANSERARMPLRFSILLENSIYMEKRKLKRILYMLLLAILFLLTACGSPAQTASTDQQSSGDQIKVLATTTIVADVVSQVGGDLIDLNVLLPVGTDPHSFDPTPQDISKVSEADLVFVNGAGLEEFLDNLIESAGVQDRVNRVSDGIEFLAVDEDGHEHEDDHDGVNPHTWTDPNNVFTWTSNIAQALSKLDPENADTYRANAQAYQADLKTLDAWIRDQVESIPPENRKLVTDHKLFGYFADEYGFEQVGALIPGYSTLSEPTAQELAEIEDAIQELDVKAIFVGNTVNPTLAERVSEDTGIQLVFVYTGSLDKSGSDAGTYIEYMRYNTKAFVDALIP